MFQWVLIFHICVALVIILMVLIQQGKGADMGASFGSGASQSVFGSKGSAPFLLKFTGFLVAVFFATSLGLTYYAKQQNSVSVNTSQIQKFHTQDTSANFA